MSNNKKVLSSPGHNIIQLETKGLVFRGTTLFHNASVYTDALCTYLFYNGN